MASSLCRELFSQSFQILNGGGVIGDDRSHSLTVLQVRAAAAGLRAFLQRAPANLAKLVNLTDAGTINSTAAKEVFEAVFNEDVDPDAYVEEHGMKQVNDEGALREAIEKVIAENPQSVEDYRSGKEKAIGFLVGQTMKIMKGKANPAMVNQILKELL